MKTSANSVGRGGRGRWFAGLTLAALACGQAGAQCGPGWIETPGYGLSGVNGHVLASVMWDPDGAGPEPEWLVIGGMFTAVDDIPASNVAAWDGEAWRTFEGGVFDGRIFERVSALEVYQGELIVGGHFGRAGSQPVINIAAWDGVAWSELGAGINGGFAEPEVMAMEVFDGKLIVTGAFQDAGDGHADFIAAWDGADWSTLGGGLNFVGLALREYGGDLYVGGQFSNAGGMPQTANIARWDGAGWSAVGSGVNSSVHGLGVHEGALYVGGSFNTAGGKSAVCVARWDGAAWSALGTGTSGVVTAFGTRGGDLYAGGFFTIAGGQAASNIARWDGAAWHALGAGVSGGVLTIRDLGDSLFVGGGFGSAGGESATGMATWDDAEWSRFGDLPLALEVRALAVHEGGLLAAGFTDTLNRLGGVMRWDGLSWSRVGGDMDELPYTVGTHEGEIYAAGWFTEAGGNPAVGVARWDGSQWLGLGAGLAGGYVTSGLSLQSFGGDLIVGGDFEFAGGVPAGFIARWDGGAWHDLGGSLGGGGIPAVYGMTIYENDLIAVGDFTVAGGESVLNVARWNGSGWSDVGGGVGGGLVPQAYAVTVFEGDLIVGGRFEGAGGVSAANVARWDGSAWHAMGEGFPHDVLALTEYNGDLIAGGSFVFDDESETRRLARWNGVLWEPVGGGVDSSVFSFAPMGSELMIGGAFVIVGEQVSPSWARWSDTGEPWLIVQPEGAEACRDGEASFAAAAPSGYEDVSYQWRKDGQPLTDGATGTGSVVSGATTGTLSIANVSSADAGSYDCVVANGCGEAASEAAALAVCDADFNCDGSANTLDVLSFLNAWVVQDPSADFNRDGSVNTLDVLAFLNAWAGGC